MAGLEKNSFLGRWDFWSPFTSPQRDAGSGAASALSEEDRMRMIDEIDLDRLSVTEPGPAGEVNDSQQLGAADPDTTAKAKKKKPKKKKTAAKSNDRHLQWGSAEQICFTRSIGYDRIPNKGSYPIGLGTETERVRSTVDELYAAQQQHLLQRAIAKGLDLTSASKHTQAVPPPPAQSPSVSVNVSAPQVPPPHGVQDSPQVSQKAKKSHRKRSNSVSSVDSNPSVASTAPAPSKHGSVDILKPLETRQFDYKPTTNPLFQALGEDERIALLTSSTVDIVHEPGSNANPLTEVNNEIKMLKSDRDSSGCSCKHTKIDKLSIAKLRQELLANGHLICYEGTPAEVEKLSKADLTNVVKKVLKECVLCTANNCECFQQGIPCSAQLCGCLRSGHNPGQAQACANPAGRDMYDPDRVNEYRRKILAELSIKP